MLSIKNETWIGFKARKPIPIQMQEYSIPRVLWESLDAVLHAKGVTLAKEIAKELGKPPQQLIVSLNTKERSKFMIIPDEESNRYECQALVKTGVVYTRCRSVVLGGCAKFCESHEHNPVDVPVTLPVVTRLIGEQGIYVTDPKTGIVYTLQGVQCGVLHGSKLVLFDISE